MKDLKLIKVSQPLYIGELAPEILKYYNRIKIPGMTYESLYTYFAQIVQYGGDKSEFWIATLDNNPCAFAVWYVCPVPYIGAVECGHVYSWARNKGVFRALVGEYEKFGKRNRCSIFKMTAINQKVFEVFQEIAKEFEYNIEIDNTITFIARK